MYLRIEDSDYPFALGLLIPSLTINSSDKNWKLADVVSNPEIMYKQISLKDFSIFFDCSKDMTSIDKILEK